MNYYLLQLFSNPCDQAGKLPVALTLLFKAHEIVYMRLNSPELSYKHVKNGCSKLSCEAVNLLLTANKTALNEPFVECNTRMIPQHLFEELELNFKCISLPLTPEEQALIEAIKQFKDLDTKIRQLIFDASKTTQPEEKKRLSIEKETLYSQWQKVQCQINEVSDKDDYLAKYAKLNMHSISFTSLEVFYDEFLS